MTRDYPHRYPTRGSSTSTEQLVRGPPPPPHTPAASAQYHREPSLGSTAPASSGRNRSSPGVLPGPYHHDPGGDTSSHGSTRRNMILGWLMGKKTTDPRAGKPFDSPLRPDVHAFRTGYQGASRSSNDVSGFSRDLSGMSTDNTRLSQSKNSSSHPHTSVDSSILRERYQSDSTMPSSVIKTDSTLLATDKTSFATDQEIFGALASRVSSSKTGSLTGKDNFSMSSRATSTVGSTSPIMGPDGEDVASPEQAKQLMEKGFRQYRHCCGRCTFCKLLVMAAFLGILGLMSYGAVVGVRGALGYGSVSAQVGDDLTDMIFDNETINDIEPPLALGPNDIFPPTEPSKTPPPIHRTTVLRNGLDGRTTVPDTPPATVFTPPPTTPKPIVPIAVTFVGHGVQKAECVTEVTGKTKIQEERCKRSPNTTIGGLYACDTYMYCVDERGYRLYQCPCGQYFHPPTSTCLPQVDGYYSDPDDCTKYWRCSIIFPDIVRTEYQCDPGSAMDILKPGECRPRDSVLHCGRT